MKILNLTQHIATPDQIEAGVVDLVGEEREALLRLLTFETPPDFMEIWRRADGLADLAKSKEAEAVMIGGAPYLMGPLEIALRKKDIIPLYAFSVRRTVEEALPDGSVKKMAVFQHGGFVKGAVLEKGDGGLLNVVFM